MGSWFREPLSPTTLKSENAQGFEHEVYPKHHVWFPIETSYITSE